MYKRCIKCIKEKDLIQLNRKKQSDLKMGRGGKKWAEDLNRHLPDIHRSSKVHERCSTSLIITEMQIKTTMR